MQFVHAVDTQSLRGVAIKLHSMDGVCMYIEIHNYDAVSVTSSYFAITVHALTHSCPSHNISAFVNFIVCCR